MRAIVNASRVILLSALLGAAFAGCDREASDQTTGAADTSGAPGSSASAPASATGASGTAASTTDSGASAAGAAPGTTTGSAAASADSSGASSTTSSSVGAAIDDSIITTKVKTALLADSDIKGSDINVETKKGEVMLSGFVDSQAQIDKALKVANAVDGVKGINNKMAVKQ